MARTEANLQERVISQYRGHIRHSEPLTLLSSRIYGVDMVDTPSYPKKKSRDLSNKAKQKIRERIIELEEEELEQSMSQTLADEFNCSPSQVAGIMAHM